MAHNTPHETASSSTGWSKLPKELKLEIYEHLISCKKLVEVELAFGPYADDWEGLTHRVVYLSKRFPWAVRGVSTEECMIYEEVLKKAYGDMPLTLQVVMPVYPDYRPRPLRIYDERYCKPEPRSPTSRETVWYMRSWCGIAVAVAYEAFESRITNSDLLFSFDLFRIAPILEHATGRVCTKSIHGVHSGELNEPELIGRSTTLIPYLVQAFGFLCVQRAIQIIFPLPEFQEAHPVDFISVIHDLRYFADNNLLEVRVDASSEAKDQEEWETWLRAVGGQIKWTFSIRPANQQRAIYQIFAEI